jgi:hypothetical protein
MLCKHLSKPYFKKVVSGFLVPPSAPDMKFTLISLAGFLPALTIVPLHAQGLGSPVLSTPGTATWATETTATGSRTIFTITGNTVLDWGQFDLPGGSELVFDFVGGESVANLLGGSSTHTIAGTVTSNGNVGFFSPNAPLRVTGSVTAANVTLATAGVDAAAFNAGADLSLATVSGSTLTVAGSVTATSGSVLLAGQGVRVAATGKIRAADAVRMAGGSQVNLTQGGLRRQLNVARGSGFVLHMGETRASRIEIAASEEINISGPLDAGSESNRIFLEVGGDGKILREGSGLLIGSLSIKGQFDDDGISLYPNDGDAAVAVTSSTLKIPALTRPGGTKASESRTLVNEVPMSASADSGRDRKQSSQQVAARDGKAAPMLKRSSFFGMRGGDKVAKR